MSWLETYRGTVYRWEVDNVDHFTVAYYFERFEDATLALLHAVGLDPGSVAGAGRVCVTAECHVRYLRELRVGDILHIRSGVIAIDPDGLVLGHQVFDSGDDVLCTTVAQRKAAESRRVEWTPAPEAALVHPETAGDDGFLDTARDTIKPWEVDALGE